MSDKGLVDAYYSIYEKKEVETVEVDIISEQDFDNLIEELIDECIEGEINLDLLEEAVLSYMDEAKVTFGHDTTPKRASGVDVGAKRRQAQRKIGDAIGKAKSNVKSKAASAAISGMLATKMAKDSAGKKITATKKKASEVKQAVKDAPGKAREAASDAKKKTKSGIKGFIKRQAQKVVSRMSEEVVETEGYQPMTPERKLRVDKAKRNAYDNDQRAQHQGDSSEADKQFKRRMAMDSKTKMRREELEATGLFTVKEIEALVESENVDEAMSSYDKNRKRAAQRAADRNAARAAGKTGVVPGVGYVTPNKERETYTDEKGTVRHKSGAKNE
jgi:hypothetical protein